MLLRDIWDLFNLGIDPINQMIPKTLISLNGAQCISETEGMT